MASCTLHFPGAISAGSPQKKQQQKQGLTSPSVKRPPHIVCASFKGCVSNVGALGIKLQHGSWEHSNFDRRNLTLEEFYCMIGLLTSEVTVFYRDYNCSQSSPQGHYFQETLSDFTSQVWRGKGQTLPTLAVEECSPYSSSSPA